MEQRVEGIIEQSINDVTIALSSVHLRGNYDSMFDKGGVLRKIGEEDHLGKKYNIIYMRFKG